jgi:hypothetical protein
LHINSPPDHLPNVVVQTDVPANLYDELKRDSTPNKITGVPGGAGTPNILVHTSCSV